MANTRLQIARSDILAYFEKHPKKIFKYSEISAILSQNRADWRLTQGLSVYEFIEYLRSTGSLKKEEINFPNAKQIRYTWGLIDTLPLLSGIFAGGYFSHYTAMNLNELTEQEPNTIYLNVEQRPHRKNDSVIDQGSLDRAFKRKARSTNNCTEFRGRRVCSINGKNSGRLGVIRVDTRDMSFDVTSIERTLIDICVRPNYSGGIFEVQRAFRMAYGRASVNRMLAMLQKLDFTYPYHQVIGFYLSNAGLYPQSTIELVRRIPIQHDFYLAHGVSELEYSEEWQLFYPRDFKIESHRNTTKSK